MLRTPMTMANKAIATDVLVLGGGPAGLAAATSLSRQLVPTIIFDSGKYRNEAARHMHNIPGFDHAAPANFRAASRSELTGRYRTNTFVDRQVTNLRKLDSGLFEATDSQGQAYTGKKVVLATGVRDLFPDIPGYADCWGRCIFHCLFCHGYEERGSKRAALLAEGLLASPKIAPAIAGMAGRLAHEVVVYTNGDDGVTAAVEGALADTVLDVTVDARKIIQVEKLDLESNERLAVHFADGGRDVLGFMAHIPAFEVNVPQEWRDNLGIELDEMKNVKVDGMQGTTCPGIVAAGDGATMLKAVSTALLAGNLAAGKLVHELVLSR
jgi:thioredoxin reductase